METDLKLDHTSWDIVIANGDLVIVETSEELCRQAVVTTLKTFRGEWFLDTLYGVPWLENENNDVAILGKTDKVFFDAEVRKAILSNPEVISIVSYSNTRDKVSGEHKIQVVIESLFGAIDVTFPLGV